MIAPNGAKTRLLKHAAFPIEHSMLSGGILGRSSVAGVYAIGMSIFYNASKWAFEPLHEHISKEVARFEIKAGLIEPGAYVTDFGKGSSLALADGIDAYAAVYAQSYASAAQFELADTQATIPAVFKIIDEER